MRWLIFTSDGQHAHARIRFFFAVTNYLLAGAPIVFTMAWAARTLQAHPLLWSPLGLLVAVSIIAAQITNSLIGTVKQVTGRPSAAQSRTHPPVMSPVIVCTPWSTA